MKDITWVSFMIKICASKFRKLNIFIAASVLLMVQILSFCSCSSDNRKLEGGRFENTRHITVAVDSMTEVKADEKAVVGFANSSVARYIHDEVLRSCNIDVTFIDSNYVNLGEGLSTDIVFTRNYNFITTYYRMNAFINMAPYLDEYSDSLSDLKTLLGDENIYSCTDDPSEVWYLTAKDFSPNARVTFIRKDWLDKLGLDAPSTREEFQTCLEAFKENADILVDNGDEIIPFFIDDDPSKSAKPLFDSFFDTDISDMDFYVNGFQRSTQKGYRQALELLNNWYLEGLLPDDFENIDPMTKEAYEPIEKGLVGSFCAQYDYLYKNGDNSHIKALKDNCGEDAEYIAVNTFENSHGEYTSWQEDYLHEAGIKICIPTTCKDTLACLIYLNWLSNADNIASIMEVSNNAPTGDPFTCDRYLLTCQDISPEDNVFDEEALELSKKTALEVKYISRGNKCVRYGTSVFRYVDSDADMSKAYKNSVNEFVIRSITSDEGEFDSVFSVQLNNYIQSGIGIIYKVRKGEWEKVMEKGDLKPW